MFPMENKYALRSIFLFSLLSHHLKATTVDDSVFENIKNKYKQFCEEADNTHTVYNEVFNGSKDLEGLTKKHININTSNEAINNAYSEFKVIPLRDSNKSTNKTLILGCGNIKENYIHNSSRYKINYPHTHSHPNSDTADIGLRRNPSIIIDLEKNPSGLKYFGENEYELVILEKLTFDCYSNELFRSLKFILKDEGKLLMSYDSYRKRFGNIHNIEKYFKKYFSINVFDQWEFNDIKSFLSTYLEFSLSLNCYLKNYDKLKSINTSIFDINYLELYDYLDKINIKLPQSSYYYKKKGIGGIKLSPIKNKKNTSSPLRSLLYWVLGFLGFFAVLLVILKISLSFSNEEQSLN